MGCNSSKHTTEKDTSHLNSDSNETAVENTEDDLDIETGAEAAAESSEAPAVQSEYDTLHTATEATPAEDQEAGASEAGQSEQTGPKEAPGPSEEL